MTDRTVGGASGDSAVFEDLIRQQGEAMRALFAPMAPGVEMVPADPSELQHWAMSAAKLQKMWLDFSAEQAGHVEPMMNRLGDIGKWTQTFMVMAGQLPISQAETQAKLWSESVALWSSIMGQFSPSTHPAPQAATPALPRQDRRFKDKRWHEQPAFALIHQTYLFLAEKLQQMADDVQGLSPDRKEQLRFATKVMTDALSPANFPFTNPVVIEKTMETRFENLVKGVERLLDDLRKGQLTHTDPNAFELGRNIALTPGKVVHETPLFQLIQYSPTTAEVLETPLLIFPPWINRFYILDLNPQNSMIRWLTSQGFTVFVASWVNPDRKLADKTFEDYMIEGVYDATQQVMTQCGVDRVNTVGYCIGGTLLSVALAHMAARGDKRINSATFFAAQHDFAEAGDLLLFTDDHWIAEIERQMDAAGGVLPSQSMADTFNALRGNDLIWSFFVSNYLMGKEPRPFDLLFWNADQTRMPKALHLFYLRNFYKDNALAKGELTIGGERLDLSKVKIPVFVQSSKEDHIAPYRSVFRGAKLFGGPVTFMLAGSGHIAGVINPPGANKYQHWINEQKCEALDTWLADAKEFPGSWWPYWAKWLKARSGDQVPARDPAKGKLKPLEDAPGSFVLVKSNEADAG